jgi:hypothetical protein
VTATWDWDLNSSASLPPGAEIWWHWEIQDSLGARLTTEKSTLTIEDPNYTWQSLKNNSISLYWAQGSKSFGNFLMNQATQSLDQFVKNSGISQPSSIKIYVYPSADDVKAATLHMPDWIGGIAYPEYDVTIMGIDPRATAWAVQVIPHEISHVVTGWRVYNCTGGEMPTWLSEGLARFAEGAIPANELTDLKTAIQNGEVPDLQGLTAGFSANAEVTTNEYTYSASVVTYLIDTFGADKMDALLGKIKEGNQIDDALRSVYNVDTPRLDHDWRVSLGLAPAVVFTSASPSTTPRRTQIPTMALWTPAVETTVPTALLLPTAIPVTVTPPATSTPLSRQTTAQAPVTPTNAGIPPWVFIALGTIVVMAIVIVLGVIFLNRLH